MPQQEIKNPELSKEKESIETDESLDNTEESNNEPDDSDISEDSKEEEENDDLNNSSSDTESNINQGEELDPESPLSPILSLE